MKNIILMIALLGSGVAHGDDQPIYARDLVGVWELEESVNYMPNGDKVPYCNGVHGRIIYTAEGYMSVALNCGQRKNDSEPADISERKFFYSGTYSIRNTEGLEGLLSIVSHKILNASDEHLIGETSSRSAALEHGELSLYGENQGQKFKAVWKKVGN